MDDLPNLICPCVFSLLFCARHINIYLDPLQTRILSTHHVFFSAKPFQRLPSTTLAAWCGTVTENMRRILGHINIHFLTTLRGRPQSARTWRIKRAVTSWPLPSRSGMLERRGYWQVIFCVESIIPGQSHGAVSSGIMYTSVFTNMLVEWNSNSGGRGPWRLL
jgi:hypothetical protein